MEMFETRLNGFNLQYTTDKKAGMKIAKPFIGRKLSDLNTEELKTAFKANVYYVVDSDNKVVAVVPDCKPENVFKAIKPMRSGLAWESDSIWVMPVDSRYKGIYEHTLTGKIPIPAISFFEIMSASILGCEDEGRGLYEKIPASPDLRE
jgi:hypothetical protein